jgi:hypothetical protein
MWTIPTPWGPIQFHFCVDELRMLMYGALGALPFLATAWLWVRSKFKKHEKQEDAKHAACCKHEEQK